MVVGHLCTIPILTQCLYEIPMRFWWDKQECWKRESRAYISMMLLLQFTLWLNYNYVYRVINQLRLWFYDTGWRRQFKLFVRVFAPYIMQDIHWAFMTQPIQEAHSLLGQQIWALCLHDWKSFEFVSHYTLARKKRSHSLFLYPFTTPGHVVSLFILGQL